MPINPNIPLSVQPIQMPDFGAIRQRQMTLDDMLRQRTRQDYDFAQKRAEDERQRALEHALAGAFDESGVLDYDKAIKAVAPIDPGVALKIAEQKRLAQPKKSEPRIDWGSGQMFDPDTEKASPIPGYVPKPQPKEAPKWRATNRGIEEWDAEAGQWRATGKMPYRAPRQGTSPETLRNRAAQQALNAYTAQRLDALQGLLDSGTRRPVPGEGEEGTEGKSGARVSLLPVARPWTPEERANLTARARRDIERKKAQLGVMDVIEEPEAAPVDDPYDVFGDDQ